MIASQSSFGRLKIGPAILLNDAITCWVSKLVIPSPLHLKIRLSSFRATTAGPNSLPQSL